MAKEILVVFQLDAVNVDVKVAEAVSVAVATELESRGFAIVDYESAVLDLESPPPEATVESGEVAKAAPILSDQQLKQAIAKELGSTHYVDGSLVRLGRFMQVRVVMHTSDGEVVAAKRVQARSEDELPLAVERIVDSLIVKEDEINVQNKGKSTPSDEANVPKGPKLEKNFGVIFGQAFGFGDIESFSQFAFDGRFELDNVIIEISPGIGFGPEAFENPQFIFDMAVSYYLFRTQISPYLGAGLGVFAGKRFRDSVDTDDEFVVGWNIFSTLGIELLRHTFMRVHIDFRYIFNYSGNRFGHAPMVLAGVNF
jgi:hypothetical protein